MLYDLRHRVNYTYESPVPDSRQAIRMIPVGRPGQRVIAATLTIDPDPAERRDFLDYYRNAVVNVVMDTPHNELAVETRARLSVERAAPADLSATPGWDTIRAGVPSSRQLNPESPVHFVFPTRLIPLDSAIAGFARVSFPSGRPIAEAALDLANRIQREFDYDPEATDVSTPISESFAARAGVCQDFAHIMLSGLRAMGLPSRYVSGYLRTRPPPGQPRLEGADATHAWVDVWCGRETGWLGFDPTNATLSLNDYIVLALGRDYSDVAPIDGVIRTYGGHSLEVAVDVIPVEPNEQAAS